MSSGWIAVAPYIVGNLENWTTEYSWNGQYYLTARQQ